MLLHFYKLNHDYPEQTNLWKLQIKKTNPERISLQDNVAVLQLLESYSNRCLNYRSLTVLNIISFLLAPCRWNLSWTVNNGFSAIDKQNIL